LKETFEEDIIRAAYDRRQEGDRYSFFNPANVLRLQELERKLLALLKKYECTNLHEAKILEVGCGSGYWLRDFIRWGANPENLAGMDILPENILHAKRLCPESVTLNYGNAVQLDFPASAFNIVLQYTVFTSILDSGVKQKIAAEMLRVLKPGGLIIWYDFHFNNPWNPDVKGIKKAEIHHLFSGCQVDLRRITLAPPLARILAPYASWLCTLLSRIPVLCTHYLGIITKPGQC
jgi:ubiquinone/menaquinone biosynthesis C-methylase UbiE